MYWYVHKIRRYIDRYIYTHKIRPWALNLKSTLVLKVLRNSFIIIFVLTKSASGMVSLPTSRQAKKWCTLFVACWVGWISMVSVPPAWFPLCMPSEKKTYDSFRVLARLNKNTIPDSACERTSVDDSRSVHLGPFTGKWSCSVPRACRILQIKPSCLGSQRNFKFIWLICAAEACACCRIRRFFLASASSAWQVSFLRWANIVCSAWSLKI